MDLRKTIARGRKLKKIKLVGGKLNVHLPGTKVAIKPHNDSNQETL